MRCTGRVAALAALILITLSGCALPGTGGPPDPEAGETGAEQPTGAVQASDAEQGAGGETGTHAEPSTQPESSPWRAGMASFPLVEMREPSPFPSVYLPAEVQAADLVAEQGRFVLEVATGTIWRVDAQSGFYAWSPTDNALALSRAAMMREGLDVVMIESQSATPLVTGRVHHAAWMPDGSHLAFVLTGSGPDRVPTGPYLISREGGPVWRLSEGESNFFTAQWAPSGEWLSYSLPGAASGAVNMQTGKRLELSSILKTPWSVWVPDSPYMTLYGSAGVAIFDPSTEQVVGSTERVAVQREGAQFSRDGRLLLIQASHARSGDPPRFALYRSPDGLQRPLLEGVGRWARLSPDGAWIAYISDGCSESGWDLSVTATSGGGRRVLTQDPQTVRHSPWWAHHANQIAFVEGTRLKLADPATGEIRTVLEAPEGTVLSMPYNPWSADGRFLAFTVGPTPPICPR